MMECELCNRDILPGDESEHHLVPKSRGGSRGNKAMLHTVCHKQLHALFGDRELEILYNTIENLKAHRDVKRFIKWIHRKPLGFNVKTRISRKNR
jgi:hypothetical protein